MPLSFREKRPSLLVVSVLYNYGSFSGPASLYSLSPQFLPLLIQYGQRRALEPLSLLALGYLTSPFTTSLSYYHLVSYILNSYHVYKLDTIALEVQWMGNLQSIAGQVPSYWEEDDSCT